LIIALRIRMRPTGYDRVCSRTECIGKRIFTAFRYSPESGAVIQQISSHRLKLPNRTGMYDPCAPQQKHLRKTNPALADDSGRGNLQYMGCMDGVS
jgi:hypothetical protein